MSSMHSSNSLDLIKQLLKDIEPHHVKWLVQKQDQLVKRNKLLEDKKQLLEDYKNAKKKILKLTKSEVELREECLKVTRDYLSVLKVNKELREQNLRLRDENNTIAQRLIEKEMQRNRELKTEYRELTDKLNRQKNNNFN